MVTYLIKNIKTNEELIVDVNLKTIVIGKVYFLFFSDDENNGIYEVISTSDKSPEKTINFFWSWVKKNKN